MNQCPFFSHYYFSLDIFIIKGQRNLYSHLEVHLNCSAWAVFMPDSSLIFSLSSNYFKIGDLYSLTNLLILLYLWICLVFSDYSLFVISFYSCQVLICSCNWFHVPPSGGRGMSYFSQCACLLSKSRRSLILYCICR